MVGKWPPFFIGLLGILSVHALPLDDLELIDKIEQKFPKNATLNSSTVLKMHTDSSGAEHVETLEQISVPRTLEAVILGVNEVDEEFELEKLTDADHGRAKRACDVLETSGCIALNADGTVYFTMRIKRLNCDAPKGNGNIFRFFAKYPGNYIMRFVNKRGSYVFVMRTYKLNQVIKFPLGSVHVNSGSKGYLLIKRQEGTGELFSKTFGWQKIKLQNILVGYRKKLEKSDFRLMKKGTNYRILEQMRPFKKGRFYTAGKCTFFPEKDAKKKKSKKKYPGVGGDTVVAQEEEKVVAVDPEENPVVNAEGPVTIDLLSLQENVQQDETDKTEEPAVKEDVGQRVPDSLEV